MKERKRDGEKEGWREGKVTGGSGNPGRQAGCMICYPITGDIFPDRHTGRKNPHQKFE